MDNDRTQIGSQYDPNKTQVGGFDSQRTQMSNSGFMANNSNQTMMSVNIPSVQMECIQGNTHALSVSSNKEHFLFKISGSGTAMGARMPLNLCLILDISGSMEGPPLEYMKQASCYVVDMLDSNDILSIVVFGDNAEVLMPARRIVNKALIKEHINRLDVNNTTNLYDGIALGASQIASVASPGYVNRALLFTDGEPTAGNKDFQSIVGQVAEQKSRGITITALGLGMEYNEELLAGIAKRSGGNYYYISRPDLIPEVFRKELEVMMQTVARNLKLSINMYKWVQFRQAYNKLPNLSNRRVDIILADLEKGETQSVLVELDLNPRQPGIYRVAQAVLTYDDSATGKVEQCMCDVVLEFTSDRMLVQNNHNLAIDREIELAQASINLEKTVMGMKTQQISKTQVIAELEKTRAFMIEQGKTMQAQDIQKAINEVQQGSGAEKTLMGTILNMDRDKNK
ncbi:MAG: VWA domain-containing protein [Armatimonadota bacterium]